MEGRYGISLGSQQVGSIHLRRQGLYYHYSCRCEPMGETMFEVFWGDIRLGLLIPQGEGLSLEGRLPVKKAGQAGAAFQVRPRHGAAAGRFVPLHPQEPFSYLRNLENAYLETRGGQVGVVLTGDADALT